MRGTAALIALAAVAMAAIATAVIVLIGQPWGGGSGEPAGPRAVIVDQLSLTAPSQAFVDDATSILEDAGYAVDYVPGEEVGVEYYRNLPSHGYEIVLLRVHAGLRRADDGTLTDDVHLFTSDPYSKKKYISGQATGLLKAVAYNQDAVARGELYFGFSDSFVTERMLGNFDGAAVVLMGCGGLSGQNLAQAFVEKGASAIVAWDELVSADHTDAATLGLLRHYVNDRTSLQDAAAATRAEVGPDPDTGAELLSYPPAASSRN